MIKILLVLSILSFTSFKLQNDPEVVIQRWYKVDGDEKFLIRELFYTNLSQGELLKSIFYSPEQDFSQTLKYRDGLLVHYGATSNNIELNDEYYHYDRFNNLIKIVDSARTSVSAREFIIKEFSKDNKVIKSIEKLRDYDIVRKHDYRSNKHIKKTYSNDTLIDYEAEYFYNNGKLKAKVKHVPETIYDSTYHYYEGNVKKLEKSFSEDGLRYSMKFKYENDTLKEIDKQYSDGAIEKIIVEHD